MEQKRREISAWFCSIFISQNQKCVYLCKDSGVAIFGGSDFNEYMKGKGLRGGTKKNKMIELQFFRKEKCESGENHLRPAQYPSGNTTDTFLLAMKIYTSEAQNTNDHTFIDIHSIVILFCVHKAQT